jgi:hypothetical protein
MSKTQEQANIQRAEAKQLLNAAFGRDVWGIDVVDRAVDCIIGAALLEMAAIQEDAMQPNGPNEPSGHR